MKYWDYVTERLPQEKIQWPGGARMAVLICFDYQAEVGEQWQYLLPDGSPNYAQITEASYGGRVGIWRLLDILDERGIKATFNTCGETAERYPESAQAIVNRGHEIAGHPNRHELHWKLSLEEEIGCIRGSVDSIERITGVRIKGWRCNRVQPSKNTMKILFDEGFVWDSDFLNYDSPYMIDIEGKGSLVEIPYTFSTDDMPFLIGSGQTYGFPAARNKPSDLYEIWVDEFNVLYRESARTPKMFIIQMHPLVIGRAHRALHLDRFLAYVKSFPDLWITTCSEIADFWLKNYNK